MRLGIVLFIALSLAGVALAGEWTTSSFQDFQKGQFLDTGSNAYVSHRGRAQTRC